MKDVILMWRMNKGNEGVNDIWSYPGKKLLIVVLLDSQQNRNDRLDFFFVYLLHGRLGRRALMGVPESDMQDVLSDGE